MNIVAACLIIVLGLSYGSTRGIPDSFSEARNRPYIPIPYLDEVWREPLFGKSPFLDSDKDYAEAMDDFPPLAKASEETDAADNNSDSEEERSDNDIKQNESNEDDNNLKEDKGDEEEKVNIEDVEDEKDQNGDDEEDGKDQNEGVQNVNTDGEEDEKMPFINLKEMKNYFKELKSFLEREYGLIMKEAALLNGTYVNTTEENLDIDGQKFLVTKSVIKTGDNNSSIFIETVDVLPEPETNRTKRSNWYAEKAQKAKESDP